MAKRDIGKAPELARKFLYGDADDKDSCLSEAKKDGALAARVTYLLASKRHVQEQWVELLEDRAKG